MSKCHDCGWEFNRDCDTCLGELEKETDRQKRWYPSKEDWTTQVDPERRSDYDPWAESYY
jgi:hypothetical protein